jgi:Uma2 family endonuclease
MSEAVSASTTFFSDRRWSIRDLERLPEGYRYEIIEGVLYMAAMPAWAHALVLENLQAVLLPWVRAHRLGHLLSAQTGIHLNEVNYVDPDLIFIRPDQVPQSGEQKIRQATLVVEVLSPSNVRAPRAEREGLFARLTVEEIWYVDHKARVLEVRRHVGGGYETLTTFMDADEVTSAIFPGLAFTLPVLWEGVPTS